MMVKRIGGFLAVCTLVAAGAGPAAAAGGIQLGPTLLFPSVTVTATHDDNIGLTSSEQESDWITTVSPALRLALPVRRFFLECEGGLDVLTYQDNDEEDATNWFVGAAVGAEFPGGLSFKVSDRHTQRYLVSSQEYGPGEDSSLNALRAAVGFAIRDALRLEFVGLRNDYAYDLSEDRERVESSVAADLYWKFRPRTSALVELGWSDYAYDSNEAQDNAATEVALGVTWDVTARSTGFAKAGYQWKRYSDENPALGIEDGDYFTVSAGVRHTFTRRTAAELELSRSSRESDFPENPYFLSTALSAGISQRFTAKIYGRAAVRWTRDDYPNETTYVNPYDPAAGFGSGERTDDTLGGSLAVGFDVTRWLSLEAGVSAVQRDSSFDTFEYDATRVSLSAKAAF